MAYTTIDKPTENFNTVLYSGNGGTQSITGVGHQPDWVWIKQRANDSYSHELFDSVRGATKYLVSDGTAAESTSATTLTSFDSDGFSLGSDTIVNKSGRTLVAWNWLAGGSSSSNGNGSITSTVSANTTAGFSIVSYTGTGSNATVGHGLGAVPKMIIVKSRSHTKDWTVYHSYLGNTKWLELNATGAEQTNSNRWNNTSPTSSVFTVNVDSSVNGSSYTYVAYCFSDIKGYSKLGGFRGNGNADGEFVYTGFSPAFVLLKNADETEQWWIFDNKRNGYAGNFRYYSLNPNSGSNEGTNSADANHIDFLSNGFKLRTTAQQLNGSGDDFIYMAFAESPFVNSNSVPTNAR